MSRYHPDGDLAPRDVVARSIVRESEPDRRRRVPHAGASRRAQRPRSLSRRSRPTCRQVGLDLAKRPHSGRTGGALPDGRHRYRRVGTDVAARACSRRAKRRAPASTAPTASRATRCSRAWCSARAPPSRCSRTSAAAAMQSDRARGSALPAEARRAQVRTRPASPEPRAPESRRDSRPHVALRGLVPHARRIWRMPSRRLEGAYEAAARRAAAAAPASADAWRGST